MWLKAVTGIVLVLATCLGAAIAYGSYRWNAGTRELRARLDAARMSVQPATFDSHEIDPLPAPVQRYFRAVLKPGQPMIAAAGIAHTGTFNMSDTAEQWKAFSSTQHVVMQRPGFDWDGRIALLPGMDVHVHDAYVNGEGILHAALLGLITLADVRGTPAMAQGELMRFLAEAAWYPTALLPSQGVKWTAVDDSSAKATFHDGATTVSLLFRFDAEGLISTVRAESRGRMSNGALVTAPWQGRFWNYEVRDGMRIPIEGEVEWELPEGRRPYWRGRLTRADFVFVNR
jgi:hypothetical protein